MRARNRKRAERRWARYVNHYAHVPQVCTGGVAFRSVLWAGLFRNRGGPYVAIRRQARHGR